MPIHNPYDGEVIHNPEASRFEIQIDRQVAVLQYRLHGDTILFTHTRVPEEMEGHGMGGRLVHAGLAYAHQQGLKVDSNCWFVDVYLSKHPEEGDGREDTGA